MPSSKHLGGVAHNIGSYAISLSKHAYQSIDAVCRALHRHNITVNLLEVAPGIYDLPEIEQLSYDALQMAGEFLEILESAGHHEGDVRAAQLTFFVSALSLNPEVTYCHVILTSWSGKVYEDWFDCDSRRVFVIPGRHKRVFAVPPELQDATIPVICGKEPPRESFREWLDQQWRLLRASS